MKTLKELADLGAAAALPELKKATSLNWCMWINKTVAGDSWNNEEPARQAFAQAVRDAVEKPLRDEITVMGAKIDELEKSVKLTSHSWFPHPPPTPPKWKLPDPPEGREWHRADWTEEMLPEGWRPLLLGEEQEQGDEYLTVRGNKNWSKDVTIGDPSLAFCSHRRTTRPLPPATKTVPLDMSDIRATDEFRHVGTDGVRLAYYWNSDTVSLGGLSSISYQELAHSYLRRQHGSTEWKPCTKEVVG